MIPMMRPLEQLDPIPTELKRVEKLPIPETEEWVEDKNVPYLFHCNGKMKYAPPEPINEFALIQDAMSNAINTPAIDDLILEAKNDAIKAWERHWLDPKIKEWDQHSIQQQRDKDWREAL